MQRLRQLAAVIVTGLLVVAVLACDAQPDGTAPGLVEPRIDPSLTPPPGSWESERRILVAFYNATGGPDWTTNRNWLTDEPLYTWHGVSTNLGRVTILSLVGNGLTGELPPELGGLTELRELYLDVNQLTGEIPRELANLTSLQFLGLSRNQLTGEVPRELINLESLEVMELAYNQLTGCNAEQREGVYIEGLPHCDPLRATQTPTPPAIGPTAAPPLTPGQGPAASPVRVTTPRPVSAAVPTATRRPTRPATPVTPAPSPIGFAWERDGLTAMEGKALSALKALESYYPDLSQTALDIPWLADAISDVELQFLNEIIAMARRDPAPAIAILLSSQPSPEAVALMIESRQSQPAATPVPTPVPSSSPTPTRRAIPTVTPIPTPGPTPGSEARPTGTTPPGAVHVAEVLAAFGGSIQWVASYDRISGWAIFDPDGSLSPSSLPLNFGQTAPDRSQIGTLAHLVPANTYWFYAIRDVTFQEGRLRPGWSNVVWPGTVETVAATPTPTPAPQPESPPVDFPWAQGDLSQAERTALQGLEHIRRQHPEIARIVLGLSWVADGVNADEGWALYALDDTSAENHPGVRSLAGFSWFADGLTAVESRAFVNLMLMGREGVPLFLRFVSLPWIADGITQEESWTVGNFAVMYRDAPSVALEIAALPWFTDDFTGRDRQTVVNIGRITRGGVTSVERRQLDSILSAAGLPLASPATPTPTPAPESGGQDGDSFELFVAISGGSTPEEIEALLDRGADVNVRDVYEGTTPLHMAASKDLAAVARVLLDNGAIVNARDNNGWTPLHLAAIMASPAVITLLLERGADLDLQNNSGQSPLEIARINHRADNVEILISKGAKFEIKYDDLFEALMRQATPPEISQMLDEGSDVKARNSQGRTPLHYATSPAIASLLLDRGAAVDARDDFGITPLMMVQTRQIAVVLLDQGADVDARNDQGYAPLHLASNSEIAELFLDRGADLEARTYQGGYTPLHASSSREDLDIVNLLLDRGAQIHDLDNNGVSFLHFAVILGPEMMNRALSLGADVNAVKPGLGTPLNTAARKVPFSLEAFKILLDHGADPNVPDPDAQNPDDHRYFTTLLNNLMGNPSSTGDILEAAALVLDAGADITATAGQFRGGGGPMHLALVDRERVSFLLDRGADINANSITGTPLHWAVNSESTAMAAYLLDRGANVNAFGPRIPADCEEIFIPLHNAALNWNPAMAELLLDRGANKDARDCTGRTPLHMAAAAGNLDVLDLLLDRGANADITNKTGYTVLNWAVFQGRRRQFEVMESLLKAGADTEIKENQGESAPLFMALRFVYENRWAELELLLDSGADTETRNKEGLTPLLYTVRQANAEDHALVSLLLDKGADIEATDRNGWTPLRLAAIAGDPGVTTLLLDRGADVSILKVSRESPGVAWERSFCEIADRYRDRYSDALIARLCPS